MYVEAPKPGTLLPFLVSPWLLFHRLDMRYLRESHPNCVTWVIIYVVGGAGDSKIDAKLLYEIFVLNIVQLQLRAAWKNSEKLKVSRIRTYPELGPLTLAVCFVFRRKG